VTSVRVKGKSVVREKDIEQSFVSYVENRGDICLKIGNNACKGYPDRLVLMDGGKLFFIEFKKPGEKPTKYQEHIHVKLRDLGFSVYWSDNLIESKAIYNMEKGN